MENYYKILFSYAVTSFLESNIIHSDDDVQRRWQEAEHYETYK